MGKTNDTRTFPITHQREPIYTSEHEIINKS